MSTTSETRDEFFKAFAIQRQLQEAAAKAMRDTPEYAQARKERRARQWLHDESRSAALMMYEALCIRLEDLEP